MANHRMALDDSLKQKIQKAIDENQALLRKREFIDAKPGYLYRNGWITYEPAIVVTVNRKIPPSELDPGDCLPRRIAGYRVDVVPADPLRQVAETPALAAALPPEVETVALNLRYKRLPGDPIDREFQISKPILCHVSPDAGWPTLKKFLFGVRDQLTIEMYDFNADYIARDLTLAAQSSNANLELVLDPNQNPVETEIQNRLEDKLQNKYTKTRASVGKNGLFDSAYHEKVAVRDSESFWLSSGNWSINSQPDVDPFGLGTVPAGLHRRYNRDWHVIVQDVELAGEFERYIRHDIKESQEGLAPAAAPMFPDLLIPQDVFLDTLTIAAEPAPVAPRSLPTPDQLPVRVQPLLTPDNYIDHIHRLIEKSERSLYLQFQYIHPPKEENKEGEDKKFTELLRLVSDRTNQEGFDTKIIIGHRDARKWLDCMEKEYGFDRTKVRVQLRVHNKGIIVDGNIVVVGSHNWSGDGTLRNRDASLIVYNSQIAQYFQNIFLNDWKYLADVNVHEEFTPMIATPGKPTPPGMVRIPWSAYYDD